MNFSIPMSEQELMRELQEMEADYWPLTVDELEVNRPYPAIPALSHRCTVYVQPWASQRVH